MSIVHTRQSERGGMEYVGFTPQEFTSIKSALLALLDGYKISRATMDERWCMVLITPDDNDASEEDPITVEELEEAAGFIADGTWHRFETGIGDLPSDRPRYSFSAGVFKASCPVCGESAASDDRVD